MNKSDERQPLLNLLARHTPWNETEKEHLRSITRFVQAEPDCFTRDLMKGHITGSAWIVNESGTQTVLVHHKKLGRWLQPGGHADGHTDIFEVARNEATEETGIKKLYSSREIFDVDVHLIPAANDIPDHYHYDIRFLFTAKDHTPLIVSDESHDVHWIAADKISEYAAGEVSILRMKEKWLSARQRGEARIQ